MLWGPPTKVVCHLLKKKYKRADLAGGERFWAGTHTVWQYDISCFFWGLGSWLLTVTGIETLILTLIHPSLYINTHTSISNSYCYSYLNIKYIDLSLCGSSLPIHVIHPIPGPWLHANLAAQTNNYLRKRNRQLYSSSMESQPVLLDACRCTVVRQDALWWNWMSQAKMRASASLRQFWLTHADALHFQIQLTSVATAVDLYLGTSTDTTLGPASLWTQQDLPHCITSGVEDTPTTAGWDPSLDERKTMPFI